MITRERVSTLYQEVCKQSPGAADRLIEEMLEPIAGFVRVFIRRRPQFRRHLDDLQGVASLELVKVVRVFQGAHKPCVNPRGVILKAVYRALSKACDSVGNDESLEDAPKASDTLGPEYVHALDVLTNVREQCKSDLENDVITLRLDGWTDIQIAEVVGVTRQTVSRAAKRVEARYDASLSLGA